MLLRPVLVSSLYLGADLVSAAKQVKTCDIAGPQAFLDFGSWDCKGNSKSSKCDFIASNSECVNVGAVCSKKGHRKGR